mgnify:CR=1 FL=1
MYVEVAYIPEYIIYLLHQNVAGKNAYHVIEGFFSNLLRYAFSLCPISKKYKKVAPSLQLISNAYRMDRAPVYDISEIFNNYAQSTYFCDGMIIFKEPSNELLMYLLHGLENDHVYVTMPYLDSEKLRKLSDFLFGANIIGNLNGDLALSYGTIATISYIHLRDSSEIRNNEIVIDLNGEEYKFGVSRIMDGVYMGNLDIFEEYYAHDYQQLEDILSLKLNPIVVVEDELSRESREALSIIPGLIIRFARLFHVLRFLNKMNALGRVYDFQIKYSINRYWDLDDMWNFLSRILKLYERPMILDAKRLHLVGREYGYVPASMLEWDLHWFYNLSGSFTRYIHKIHKKHIDFQTIYRFIIKEIKDRFEQITQTIRNIEEHIYRILNVKTQFAQVKFAILAVIVTLVLDILLNIVPNYGNYLIILLFGSLLYLLYKYIKLPS